MICLKKAKKFCKDYTKIENYDKAVNDTTHTWICHHILGEILTPEQLIEHNFYYDVPPCMLKFVTKSEHESIHKRGDKNGFYGKKHSDETRARMSTSHKGKHHSDETRRRISDSHKGIQFSEEHRRNIAEAKKRYWQNKRNEHNV